MSSLQEILEEITQETRNNRDKGTLFERLILNYLKKDPQYANRLSNIWLWSDWPYRWGADDGIDLVAVEQGTGKYWAIQCKFYEPTHQLDKKGIDSFLAVSSKFFIIDGKEYKFSNRLIVSTTSKWSSKAEKAIKDQTPKVFRLDIKALEDSPIDWSQFSLVTIKAIKLKKKHELREHQKKAVDACLLGFLNNERGKLIMACGTGKTFTALRLMEQVIPESGWGLFLAPSISLISQSLREWTAQAIKPINALVVCSDSKVGKDEEDIPLHDMAFPATTNAKVLANHVALIPNDRRTIIFSTYQSIQVVSDAQQLGLKDFDLIICDEAHRTTGITVQGESHSEFVKVHHNKHIKGKNRLYMTATPRIYGSASKTKANDKSAVLFSMDDEITFGPEFYKIGFGEAVEKDLLSEYKVLIVTVEEERIAQLTNNYNAYKVAEKKAMDIKLATKIIGSWKGLSKQGLMLIDEDGKQEKLTEDTSPMRRAVAFSRTIKASKDTSNIFSELVTKYMEDHQGTERKMVTCSLEHVDGSMNARVRLDALNWLKDNVDEGECRILSNARCLSEGIDVPALDSVIFFDTRESIVDIVQSVGRVMRKDPSGKKKYGYIILPVCIPSKKVEDYNHYIETDPQFKSIWKVIKALRAHDESLVDEAEFRRKIKVIGSDDSSAGNDDSNSTQGSSGEQLLIGFPDLPLDAINEAVYAAIPKKLGDREYWSEWAKDVGRIAGRLITRITSLISSDPEMEKEFTGFLNALQNTLNPAITDNEAIEMLAQHTLTLPVFQALFAESEFPENNAVAKVIDKIVNHLDGVALSSETESLDQFYKNVQERISLAKSDKSKQEIVRNLYDTFFQNAFPRMAERLGIVYTPIEIVDFIIHSVQFSLQEHFSCNLGDRGVQVLDPFTGTGTFLVRLIQSGLINKKDLPYKFDNELHANDIILLAYYIASVNLETAFHMQTGTYKPFNGMVLTDTFQMTEEDDLVDKAILKENNDRATKQLEQEIKVIIGNPPYSVGQNSANDNNQNLKYPTLDNRIRETYAQKSSAVLKNSLYDSYIRAIRWATDRLNGNGIVAFVTNGSFIDGNAADGVRKSLTEEYSHIYIFNLRGNQRTSGEESRKEGGKIFGSASRTPVTISIMVKDKNHEGPCELKYCDIGSYLKREQKLAIIEDLKSIKNVNWQPITPNTEGDWLNQRSPAFDNFITIAEKTSKIKEVIFNIYSNGVKTNRDAWAYNMDVHALELNMKHMIDAYNNDSANYTALCKNKSSESHPNIDDVIDTDPRNISWTRELKKGAEQGHQFSFNQSSISESMYRPFSKQWLYFNNVFNNCVYLQPKLFPTSHHYNIVISVTGIGASRPFSALVTDVIPNLHLHDTGQTFPLFWYEKPDIKDNETHQKDFFTTDNIADEHGYIRHDAITDWALNNFRKHYNDCNVIKEDIFWYVYGLIHSTEYKERFQANLKKVLLRIPFAGDFWAFSKAGKHLGELHLNYETIEPYPLEEHSTQLFDDFRVVKMAFAKKDGQKDKSVIVYNSNLTLQGIPLEAYEYEVNGKSAIEWIMDRYKVTVDKKSHIKNDPNQWSDNPRYIIDLLKKIVIVSVETVKIVESLPPLNESKK